MKHIRMILAAVLCIALLLPVFAQAELPTLTGAQYATTVEFMAYCDENGIYAEYEGIYSTTAREAVSMLFQNETLGTVEAVFLFDRSENSASLSLWDIVTVAPEKADEALTLLNRLNHTYRYCKLSMDPETLTVSMDTDLALTAGVGTAGDECYRCLIGTLQSLSQFIGELRALEE